MAEEYEAMEAEQQATEPGEISKAAKPAEVA